MVKRVAIAILALATITACDHTAPELNDSTRVFKYTGFGFYTNGNKGGFDDITLHFEDPRTGKKSDAEMSAESGAYKLDWLNKGNCYTEPLSSSTHKQVTCG